MTPPLTELKIRARLQLNAARKGAAAGPPRAGGEARLRHCLNEVAAAAGFVHWEHARRVLGGEAAPGDDMGVFWHAPRCDGLLNQWFTSHRDARDAHAGSGRLFLLPYRRQYLLAGADFIRELGLQATDPAWDEIEHDLVQGYGTSAWLKLAAQRIRAPSACFAVSRARARAQP